MEQRRAALVRIPPPILYAGTFVVGWLIDRWVPCAPHWLRPAPLHWLGWALIVAGVLFAASAAGLFVRRRTTLHPGGRPAQLVTTGPFALTRNPMYVSLTLVYLGAALVLARLWPLLLVVLPWAAVNWLVIPFEEARLADIFGAAYAEYRRRVRRWL